MSSPLCPRPDRGNTVPRRRGHSPPHGPGGPNHGRRAVTLIPELGAPCGGPARGTGRDHSKASAGEGQQGFEGWRAATVSTGPCGGHGLQGPMRQTRKVRGHIKPPRTAGKSAQQPCAGTDEGALESPCVCPPAELAPMLPGCAPIDHGVSGAPARLNRWEPSSPRDWR